MLEYEKILNFLNAAQKLDTLSSDSWEDTMAMEYIALYKFSMMFVGKLFVENNIVSKDDVTSSIIDKEEFESEFLDNGYDIFSHGEDLFYKVLKNSGWEVNDFDFSDIMCGIFQSYFDNEENDENASFIEVEEIQAMDEGEFNQHLSDSVEAMKDIFGEDIFNIFEKNIFEMAENLRCGLYYDKWIVLENKEVAVMEEVIKCHTELADSEETQIFKKCVHSLDYLLGIQYPKNKSSAVYRHKKYLSIATGYIPDTGEEVTFGNINWGSMLEVAVLPSLMQIIRNNYPEITEEYLSIMNGFEVRREVEQEKAAVSV